MLLYHIDNRNVETETNEQCTKYQLWFKFFIIILQFQNKSELKP